MNGPDMIDSELQDILVECARSTKLLARTFLPDNFDGPMTHIHEGIFELFDSKEKYIAIAAPRGIGKTTSARAKALQQLLFREKFVIPWVSKSHDSSVQQTENLKRDLVMNKEIKKIFGPIKTKAAEGFEESFSKKSWVAYDTMVTPKGAKQQIRGMLFGNKRPDLFIVDDLEDDEYIDSKEYRDALKIWFHSVLMKAVSRYSHDFKIIYIDTLKHEDALLQELLDSSRWASARFELFDDNHKSLVPEIMSDADVHEEVEYHRDHGMLDVLYREYRNLPTAKGDNVFQQEFFQYYDPVPVAMNKSVEFVVICDPAKTVKLHSAHSAIVGIGLDQANGYIYIHDIVSGMFYPDELYNEMFSMCGRLGASVLAVEETSLNEFIKQPIRNEAVERRFNGELVWLKARAGEKDERGKDKRIASLAPYYRQGYIWHNKAVCGGLEAQLLSFPRSKLKDIMDATSYIVELMDIGSRYFEPPDDADEEFEELENEPALEDWRAI
jgi:hypothetical protein